jgi:hypothetical protein
VSEALKCQCQSSTHSHDSGKCANDATEIDRLCKSCHDQAAAEGLAAIQALSEPPRIVSAGATLAGVGEAFFVAKVLTSLPSDHPFYAVIGRVAAEAARLEHTFDLIIWELSGVNHELGSCITGQLAGSYGRFNAIQALAAAKGCGQELLDEIETLANKSNNALRRRHRFVHDAWYTEGGAHAGQFKSLIPKEAKFGIHDVSKEYAEQTIELLKKRATEVGELRSKLQKL